MPILTRPGQNLQTADNQQIGTAPAGTNPHALQIEEYTGIIEGTLARKSIMHGWIPVRSVKGTSTITNYRVGEATLSKVTPGVAPTAGINQFGKVSVTVDTMINARNTFFLLDDFQQSYDARAEVGKEQGKKHAKFYDQAMMTQAIKAALMSNAGMPAGWKGGNAVSFTAANDEKDPAKLYAKLAELFTAFEMKDVDPMDDDLICVVNPQTYYILLQADALVNSEILSSAGNSVQGKKLAAFGVPIYSSNNLPQTLVANHELSNAGNSMAYDGDFTKVIASVFSPRALLAGETIPLTTDVFYESREKLWYADSHTAFAVTPNRPEFAGLISKF